MEFVNALAFISAALGSILGILTTAAYLYRLIRQNLRAGRVAAEVTALDQIAATAVQYAEQTIPDGPEANAKRKELALHVFDELTTTRRISVSKQEREHWIESAVFARTTRVQLPVVPDRQDAGYDSYGGYGGYGGYPQPQLPDLSGLQNLVTPTPPEPPIENSTGSSDGSLG